MAEFSVVTWRASVEPTGGPRCTNETIVVPNCKLWWEMPLKSFVITRDEKLIWLLFWAEKTRFGGTRTQARTSRKAQEWGTHNPSLFITITRETEGCQHDLMNSSFDVVRHLSSLISLSLYLSANRNFISNHSSPLLSLLASHEWASSTEKPPDLEGLDTPRPSPVIPAWNLIHPREKHCIARPCVYSESRTPTSTNQST